MMKYNFCAGPAMLPKAVLAKAQQELLDWQGMGVSVMEVSHRAKDYMAMARDCEARLRALMTIPEDYSVLFMQGGGRGQFAAVPLNLGLSDKPAVYVETGIWSKMAADEAQKHTDVIRIDARNDTDSAFDALPVAQWPLPEDAAYIHYCPNETIEGIELFDVPKHSAPIVADMSSTILSREMDISQFDVIYAGAQKNIGPSGLAIVIIKNELLARSSDKAPGFINYQLTAENDSMFNTPPTFAWYLADQVFIWLEEFGGMAKMAEHNQEKARILYDYLDASPYFYNKVAAPVRSLMNIPFWLKDESLNALFLEKASEAGLLALEGHRYVGGMRASVYNAMPVDGVRALVAFMDEFAKEHMRG